MTQFVLTHYAVLMAGGLVLLFAFSNGFRDSSTIVATVVSTRVLSPVAAFSLCAVFEFCGALLLGTAVASTIGKGILGEVVVRAKDHALMVMLCGLSSAIIWGWISWWRVWPTSNNHALLAGLLGASWALLGPNHTQNVLIVRVLCVLVLSPLAGLLISSLITGFLAFLGNWLTPRVKPIAESLHVLSCLMVSCAHGSNDGQMSMGVLMVMAGLTGAVLHTQAGSPDGIPMVIRVAVATALSLGVLVGGRNILKKLGMKFYRIRPPQGLGAQLSSAGTVLSCAMMGLPASTTQVITGSIVGAGVARNPRAIRWNVAQDILLSWFLTLPSVAMLAFFLCRAFIFLQGLRS